MMYTVNSLFSGAVDGFGIAFTQAGFYVSYHMEIDAWCCAVLRMNHPRSIITQKDIRDVETIPYTDVVVGSPPCQPWSGATNGKRSADDRHLWPEMFRLIRAGRPRVVVVENTASGVSRGLADEICMDLESAEYTTETLVLPARAVGASHYRNRLFVVAYTRLHGRQSAAATRQPAHHQERHTAAHQQSRNPKLRSHQSSRAVLGWSGLREPGMERNPDGSAARIHRLDPAKDFPGWPALQGQRQNSYEPSRLIQTEGSEDVRRIRALGNCIVWQQVFPLAQAVKQWLEAQDTAERGEVA